MAGCAASATDHQLECFPIAAVDAVIMAAFISQLRANAPIFSGRVAGAAEFYAGLRNYNTSMPLPAAYVLPLG